MAQKTGNAWVTFICVLLAGMSYAISLMAVPTVMPQIAMSYADPAALAADPMAWLGMMPQVGLLMSWNSVAGTILAIFTGPIQSKVGPKAMVIAALVCVIISDVAMCFQISLTAGMVVRFILGFANGLVATAAPTVITILFKDPNKRGLPNGIWSMWIALGGIIISYTAAPLLGETGMNWHNCFIFATIWSVIVLILVILFVRLDADEVKAQVAAGEGGSMLDAFKSGYVWLCFIMMICFAYGFSCYSGNASSYFQSDIASGGVGMTPEAAQRWFGLLNFIGIIAGLLAGVILSKIVDCTKALVVIFVLGTISTFLSFQFTSAGMAIFTMFLFGIFVNMVVPVIFSNVPMVSDKPAVVAGAFGICAIASNGGGIPANPTMGMIVASGAPWQACAVPPTIVFVIGLICAIVFMVKRSAFAKEVTLAGRAK